MDEIKEKAKELAEKLGLKLEGWTDEQLVKLAAAKDEMDADTRRKTRAFWAPVGVCVGVVIGYAVAVVF